MSITDLHIRLALQYVYRYQLRALHELISHYPSPAEAWSATRDEKKGEAMEVARREVDFIDQHGISVYAYGSTDYPYRLNECADAPYLLFGKGNIHFNRGKFVSVVGTRDCTDHGRELTRRLVLDLSERVKDLTIVSGLAYGIDIAAHKAALDAHIPTLVVAGHGLDRIYPAVHRNIAVATLHQGGILTEYPSHTEPERQNFVARDRIIAGLADAVVVVESKEKGGSLITAHMACDYNRSLFAFPGRVTDVSSRGCNGLIKSQKAALIESADDLIHAMMWQDEREKTASQTELVELFEQLTETEQKILYKLRENEDGMHINFIIMELSLPYSEVLTTLTMMEMRELVKSLPGGIYRALK